ncbi:ANTAR domain-containing protein [Streptomyces sp. NP160]|uniref:ANTAR domain-containing protein n=1 Tax=Streptomyces sp. NP160 TaxID=2586637 RepID=UPI0015D65427|nr:ANTAR domain-containing protein [Streptomyces sp. NP160]
MSAQSSSTPSSSASPVELLELRVQRLTEELAAADRELAAQQRDVEVMAARREAAREAARQLVHALPAPVITTDADGGIEHSNPAASALLAVPSAALVSTPVQAFVATEDRPLVRSLLSRAGREGTVTARLRLQPREGQVREVHAVVSSCTEVLQRRLVVLLPVAGPVQAGVRPEGPGSATPAPDGAPPAPARRGAAGPEVLRSLGNLVELAVSGAPGHQLLAAVAAAAVAAVPGATSGSASTGDPAQPTDSAADSAEAQAVDGAQWAADEGPALLAHSTGEAVWTSDVSADERWPRLAMRTAGGGVRSAVSVPLRDGDRVTGVVSAYSSSGAELDAQRAEAYAAAASAVLSAARRTADLVAEVENLKLAMQSRAAIEQAKGAVASRLDCTVEEAFAAMVVMSQDRNVKVRDIGLLVAASPGDRSLDEPLRVALERARQRSTGRPRA